MAQSNSKPPIGQNFGFGASHARSLSQPHFFANNCLPPMPPANSGMKDVQMDEVEVNPRGTPIASVVKENVFRGSDSLPPRKGHRRSNSDVPMGFSAMIQSSPQLMPISGHGVFGKSEYGGDFLGREKPICLQKREIDVSGDMKLEGEVIDELFSSYMNLDNMERFNTSGTDDKDKDSMVSGTKMSGGDSGNEVESVSKGKGAQIHITGSREGVKRCAAGDIAPTSRHCRSLSMDSALENLNFGDESPKLPASLGNWVGQLSPSNSGYESSSKLNFDVGNAEFNEAEMKKIMADERLAEIATSDPRRVKRILANRQSAARSKERKVRYISELELKVQTLQSEATTLSAQVNIMQKDLDDLSSHNHELKFRLQAMEQQAQLRDALHEALTAEVQRLKVATGELSDECRLSSSCVPQEILQRHMSQMQRQQPGQGPQLSMATSRTAST
ncbi:PREDICTED: transcription factor RF2a-like isoform X2 [Ipomoea nil]|uniref:transcription factor RF2a-like isoform X2 n=1 Tax=Ipomoea nil TaxID=35883 RepID=UPI000901F0B5|nr:PREDICTED: transcription factor RF2a-like isoform X2 [Ipomoea nil]